MPLELTPEQQQAVQSRPPGAPVEVIDPRTRKEYILLPRDQYEQEQAASGRPAADTGVPPGILRSQEALRRALPELLAQPRLRRQWVAYHGEERIGVAANEATLLRECCRRGLEPTDYYIGWIDPSELAEDEELSAGKPEQYEDHEDLE